MTTVTEVKKPFEPLNSAKSDYYTDNGSRVSTVLYLDIPMEKRKLLYNALRTKVELEAFTSTPPTLSGIQTVTANSSSLNRIEAYVGVSLSVLRGVLFQRGGVALDLILRIQEASGLEVISTKELAAALDSRKKQVVNYIKENPFNGAAA
jgi:hypothetical protein